jgi:DNA-binding FadR family transcriptional regulator
MRHSLEEHRQIFDAITVGAASLAVLKIQEHLTTGKQMLLGAS